MADKEQLSQKAAYVLMECGIQPWKASTEEIALAERLVKEFRYIDSAASEFKFIISGRQRQ